MPSTMRTVAAVTLAFSALTQLSTASPASSSSGAMSSAGCFNSSTPLSSKGTWKYQSTGYCQQQCEGYSVMALSDGNACYCGNTLPAKSSMQSDDSECNMKCVGYPDDTCGGDGYWSVFYTGSDTDVDYYNGGSSSGSSSSSKSSANSAASSSTTAAPSQSTANSPTTASNRATVITSIAPGKTVVITQTPAAAATTAAEEPQKSHKGGSNTAGIAAGVVVAVVVIAALIGAAFFFWRRRQRQQAESGHQQLPDYSNNTSRPMTYKPAPGPDSRLDHDAMAQRRMSDGSIADNQDYSRRILKVTNPDDR